VAAVAQTRSSLSKGFVTIVDKGKEQTTRSSNPNPAATAPVRPRRWDWEWKWPRF